jgi:hypothetical protein
MGKARSKVGDVANGQRLVAKIPTWCRVCDAWRTHSVWKVTRVEGVELAAVEQHHVLHCELCGGERRLERMVLLDGRWVKAGGVV